MYVWALLTLSLIWGCCASKPGCCMPNQFETSVLMAVGSCYGGGDQQKCEASYTEMYMRASLDGTRKMVNVYLASNPDTGISRILQDFAKKKEYLLNDDGSKCKVINLTKDWTPPCIPADSTKLMSTYVGIQPGSKFDVDLYRASVRPELMAGAEHVQAYVSVAADDCTVVAESISGGKDGNGFLVNLNWYNTTKGIKDPSVFDIPPSCSHDLIEEPVFRFKSAVLP